LIQRVRKNLISQKKLIQYLLPASIGFFCFNYLSFNFKIHNTNITQLTSIVIINDNIFVNILNNNINR